MIRLTLCCNTGIYARCINTCGTSFVRLYLVWITNNHVMYEIMNYWSGRHQDEMQIRSYLLTKDISWVHHSPAVRKCFNIQLFYSLEVHTGAMVLLPAGICTFYIFLNVKPTYKIKDKTPKLTSWSCHIAYLLFLNTMWVAALYFCFYDLFNIQ